MRFDDVNGCLVCHQLTLARSLLSFSASMPTVFPRNLFLISSMFRLHSNVALRRFWQGCGSSFV